MKIRRLSEEIVKRIAAGEVVERPASVVKELVENALDAQAQRIEVEIKGAGRLLIRVTDDGEGMDKEDLGLAAQRHTTSKIETTEDIDHITTLGFRGEALYSIAAVSRLEITSRTHSNPIGYRLLAEGGKVLECSEAGAPAGTQMQVQDLFWNTPARLKFLKSPNTEINHIFETMALYSLVRPDVGFRLKDGDKILLDVDASGDLLKRIQSLYQGLGQKWIPIHSVREGMTVTGYLGHPEMSRANRSFQFFFVNRRPVKAPALSYAIEASFHSLVPESRHPIAFVMMDMDPESMDINVHPAKKEIRFHRTQWVQDQLREAIRQSLSSFYSATAPSENILKSSSVAYPEISERVSQVKESIQTYFKNQGRSHSFSAQGKRPLSFESLAPMENFIPSSERVHSKIPQPSFENPEHYFKALGCFDHLYWVIQLKDGLALMDQHAAHERVLYEKYLRAWKEKRIEVQSLLLPVGLDLVKEDQAAVKEHESILKDLGFAIEEFGPSSILISQVPAYCQTHQLKEMILDIFDDLKTLRKTTAFTEIELEEKIILRACKSAVKAHDAMKLEEIERLIEELFQSELPYTCPHGRPTLIKFTGTDLAKMFKRK